MSLRTTNRFWNRLALGSLVLLVTGAALCTVAVSATAHDRTPSAPAALAPPDP